MAVVDIKDNKVIIASRRNKLPSGKTYYSQDYVILEVDTSISTK